MKLRTLTKVRARNAPLVPAAGQAQNIAGVIPAGTVVAAQWVPKSPGWLAISQDVGGVTLLPSVLAPYSPYLYALHTIPATATSPAVPLFIDLDDVIDPPPPPPPPSGVRVGVSVLNAHHILESAYLAGVRVFLIMNGLQTARDFKTRHPDAIVFYREFMEHGRYLPDATGGKMRELQTIGHGIILMSPCNEGDIWPQKETDGMSIDEVIGKRATFDTEMAKRCRDNGTLYASGGWSVGNPDFTNPALCAAMEKHYAPGYNSNLFGVNYHSYSPNPGNIFVEDGRQIWHETRWRFLFDKCGFLNVHNDVGIVSDETGLDEGGIGGVPAHGLGADFVERWTRRFIAISSLPVQGKPSPFRAATWFQAGDADTSPGHWGGFDVQHMLGAIVGAHR